MIHPVRQEILRELDRLRELAAAVCHKVPVTRGSLHFTCWVGSAVGLALLISGCTEVAPPPQQVAVPVPAVAPAAPPPSAVPQLLVAQEAAPAAAVPVAAPQAAESPPRAEPPTNAPDEAKPRRVIGKTTTNVRDAQKEEDKGAQRIRPRVTGQDPITVSGNAYSAIVSRAEQLQIKHSLDLYYNLNGHYPKDLNEFMTEIIKKNGIRLAQLPFYQEYGYDAVKHELVILEYPDRKASLPGK